MAPNSLDLKFWIALWEAKLEAWHKCNTTEDDCRIQGNPAADDLGLPASGTDLQSSKEASKATDGLC